MVGAAAGMRLTEPVHLANPVRGVHVTESLNRVEACARLLDAPDADENVDDRLRFKARHRRAADVVDAALDPLADRGCKHAALRLKSRRPLHVVGNDPDRLVTPRRRRLVLAGAACTVSRHIDTVRPLLADRLHDRPVESMKSSPLRSSTTCSAPSAHARLIASSRVGAVAKSSSLTSPIVCVPSSTSV